ncbi:hypothetical protein SAMN05518846_108120 [Brevibacillus centrosporus]|uniref:Uncharacterized protein n=1 Tax=Brevibacillus centrosporus TaxID=54910 RepID=A0A1I3WJY6_9BACL|nr:hypothetical protein SAMN05518846_108120 [Brevibacillus centrosporus]
MIRLGSHVIHAKESFHSRVFFTETFDLKTVLPVKAESLLIRFGRNHLTFVFLNQKVD